MMFVMSRKQYQSNAIIGFGVGYKFEQLQYFIRSCHQNLEDTDVFLFVGNNIDQLRQDCAGYPSIHLVRYQENIAAKVVTKLMKMIPGCAVVYARMLRSLSRVGGFRSFADAMTLPLTQFMVKRFFIIHQFLKTIPHKRIMITDIRDVIVQDNPFKFVTENTIMTGIEPVTNGECNLNSKWIKNTFTQSEFEQLKDKLITCAGVTIGSRRAIEQYVNEMIDSIYANIEKIIGMLGADQAIHTKLFYEHLKGVNTRFEENGRGYIATLHFSKLDEFFLHEGRLFNSDSSQPAVVHQYDRHTDLARYLMDAIEKRNNRHTVHA